MSGNTSLEGGEAINLAHVPETSHPWEDDELKILEESFSRLSSENVPQPQIFLRIATLLPQKTARDVAMKCCQIELDAKSGLSNGNGSSAYVPAKRKKEEFGQSKRSKDRKGTDLRAQENEGRSSPVSNSVVPTTSQEEVKPSSNSTTTALLQKNEELLNVIKENMASNKNDENNGVFLQLRDNILTVLNEMTVMPGIMSQMPPLPVKLNLDLANQVLHEPGNSQSAPQL